MKHILITGANGLLGYELVSQLIANKEFKIYSISRNVLDLNSENLTQLNLDLSLSDSFDSLPTKMDIVIHLAQSNEFRNFPAKAIDIFNINIQSTQYLLNYALQSHCQKFIFASTGGVYSGSESPYLESNPIHVHTDLGYYPKSKIIAEQLILAYQSSFDCLIFRPFFIYGKRQKNDMLIPRLIEQVKNDKALNIDGEIGLQINPIYVSDAAKAIVHSITDKIGAKGIYNLGGPDVISLKEIGDVIGNQLNKNCQFNYNKDKKPQDVCGNIDSLSNDIYTPETSFYKGIKKMLHEE